MRNLLAVSLMLTGALAGCLDSTDTLDPADYVSPGIPEVDTTWTLNTLQTFLDQFPERADNLDDHEGARDWMADQFESFGLDVYRQQFTNGIAQENILGILWGEVTDTWVVVGGHYDMTVSGQVGAASPEASGALGGALRPFSEGAYDDGSGTLQTIALAKAFAEQYQSTGIKPYYTMVFAPFDGEERGLHGSQAFVEALLGFIEPFPYHDGNIEVRGMLNLDMAGLNWPGVDVPIYFDDNSPELQMVVEEERQEMGMPDEAIEYHGIALGRSDYAHFMDAGIPTGFFISNFEEWQAPANLPYTFTPTGSRFVDGYPFWHLEDTWETMVAMAGSEEDLHAGFDTILTLSARVLHDFAMEPTVDFTATIIE